DHIVGLHGNAAIDSAPEIVHLDLTAAAMDRDFGNTSDLRTGIVDVSETKTAAFALPAPVRHLGDALDCLNRPRCVLQELKPQFYGIDAALERDLVHERLGRKLVGGESDAAQGRGAHTRVLIELLDELMRYVVAL